MFTARQLKAARALLGWEQSHLAEASGLSIQTVKRMEGSDGIVRGNSRSLVAIHSTINAAGVEFTNGGQPGVRMQRAAVS